MNTHTITTATKVQPADFEHRALVTMLNAVVRITDDGTVVVEISQSEINLALSEMKG